MKTQKFTTGPNKVLLVLGQMMVLIMRTEEGNKVLLVLGQMMVLIMRNVIGLQI